MAKLTEIAEKIDNLRGDMTYREVKNKSLDYLAEGRRANHTFVVRSNIRTLKSGPNRGKVRVDGAIVVMFSNNRRNRQEVLTSLVRKGNDFLPALDRMANTLYTIGS